MYLHLLYFKTNSKALIIVLLQPCHVILLLEGIAVVSRSTLGVKISLFILPALIGTLLAMLFPDTSGLEQFLEEPSYWVQHYLIQAVPLYLLCRRNLSKWLGCAHGRRCVRGCGSYTLFITLCTRSSICSSRSM